MENKFNSMPKLYKAFILILTVIFLVFIITAFIYGLRLNFIDNSNRRVAFEETGYFSVFIGGAVENEGFYEVRYSTTYGELFNEAKVLNHNTLSRFNDNEAIKFDEGYIICHYKENFETKNINYAEIYDLVNYCGLLESSAVAIKDYIKQHGEINDKNLLVEKSLLTKEEFNEVKYKIYAYII